MWAEILSYILMVCGGFLGGVAVVIYRTKKYRVIHDLIGLFSCLLVSALMVIGGIIISRENAKNAVIVVEQID